MAPVGAVEYRKDVVGERLYASRNHNQLRHTYDAPGANRSGVDWNLTLRQVGKPLSSAQNPAYEPHLETESRVGRRKEPLVAEHVDGPYHSKWQDRNTRSAPELETVGKYQNLGNTGHMLSQLNRVSSGTAYTVDWQLNLRDGTHGKKDDKWRRNFTRSQQTFDMMLENCSKDNEAYQKSHITPQDRRPDRRSGALSIHTRRDDPMNFMRMEGNEGTNVGQWRHLLEDRRHGHKHRSQMQADTLLRAEFGEPLGNKRFPNGARIDENRSDGCIVEMLGKKKWVGHESHEPLAQRPPDGDSRLYHFSRHRILPEADEDNREKRMMKQPRRQGQVNEVMTRRTRSGAQDADSP